MGAFVAIALVWAGLAAVLALPALIRQTTWKRFFVAVLISALGIVLPLFVFLASALLAPDSKSGCQHGWVDCFQIGKLALTPLVLWATSAFYSVEVYGVAKPTAPWIVLGYCVGALVSSLCLAAGLFCAGSVERMYIFFLVPGSVVVWYTLRAVQLVQSSEIGIASLAKVFLGTLPFWLASVLWSRSQYRSLPEASPCFVVGAAARGHRRLVGPFFTVVHHGRSRIANRQLMTLWQFEAWWRDHAKRSHALFRRAYNHLGPVVARRISSAWKADLAYLMLKPVEFVAQLFLKWTGDSPPTSGGFGVPPD